MCPRLVHQAVNRILILPLNALRNNDGSSIIPSSNILKLGTVLPILPLLLLLSLCWNQIPIKERNNATKGTPKYKSNRISSKYFIVCKKSCKSDYNDHKNKVPRAGNSGDAALDRMDEVAGDPVLNLRL